MTDPATLAAWDQRYLWHPFTQMADWLAEEPLVIVGVGYSETFHRFVAGAVVPAVRLTPPHVFRWQRGMDAESALAAALDEAEQTLAAHGPTLAAVIVEPLVQGAAGMWVHPPAYLRALHDLAHRHGTLLVADEVATGFGRTGRMFACEHAGITPDLMCLAKGISGGYLPLAATLATEEVFAAFLGPYEEFRAFFHGHTYTGNPLGCAVALASLRRFREERTLERLAPKNARLRERLAAEIAPLEHVGGVRQQGVMVGIELVAERAGRVPYPPAARIGQRVVRAARTRGVILRPLGNVIVLMPALSIAPAELERLVDVAREAIEEVTGA